MGKKKITCIVIYNSLNVIHASISGQAESCLQATHTQPNPKEK